MSNIAYFNGKLIPAEQATVSVADWGFVQGVTLAEQLRTFRHMPFLVDWHLDRLFNGFARLGWDHICKRSEISHAINEVVRQNTRQIPSDHDLGITVFVTPGLYPIYDPNRLSSPTVGVHTYPLPFQFWQHKYSEGERLVTVRTQQVPAACWPHELKCRSRMHYYLAALEAKQTDRRATALLLDDRGHVSETPTANVVAYFEGEGLISPERENILPGISLRFLTDLAGSLGVTCRDRNLTVADLHEADELIVTSTPYGLLPVSQLDQCSFPHPGPITQSLLEAWSQHVGVDLVDQAQRVGAGEWE